MRSATAGRPLSEALLGDVTGLTSAALASALHDLDARHLLRTGRSDRIGLRHALLAEAAARRLTAHETADEHRRLASSLAATPDPVAAEVAEHWQRAGDTEQELVWRIRAAQQAASRFAFVQAAAQWRRALDLWPDDGDVAGSPEVRRVDAYLAALDALWLADAAAGRTVAEEALRALDDHTGRDAADTYRHAAGFMEETDEALRLAERAVAIYEQLPPCPGYVKALATQADVLDGAGREREAKTLAARATEVSAGLGDPVLHRTRLAVQATLEPRPDVALAQIQAAAGIELPESDLFNDVYVATIHTHLLLTTNAAPEEVAAAARPVLRAAAGEEHETWPLSALRYERRDGLPPGRPGRTRRGASRPEDGGAGLVPHLGRAQRAGPPRRPARSARGGRPAARGAVRGSVRHRSEQPGRDHRGRSPRPTCGAGVRRLRTTARWTWSAPAPRPMPPAGSPGSWCWWPVPPPTSHRPVPRPTREQLLGTVLALRDEAVDDPFEPLPADRVRSALASSWTAETLRLSGRAGVETWVAAARGWDRLTRPHEAAYCRWRAAEVALRTGQGSAARTLLQRARHDAREHVPLLAAIAATG